MTDEHVFSPEEDDNNEHEEDSSRLLDNFLNKIAGVMNLDEKKEEDFKMFSSDDFDNPGISDELKEKIDRLQEITRSIEGKYGLPAPGGFDSKKFMIDYVNELNPSQFMAATLGEGPVLVLAGAGSGKTRVITHRVSYLLETGVNPEEILLLTFTRKAAREMLNRVEGLLRDESPRKVNGGTFHSFASYILRKYSNLLGISPSFTIIDAEDSADTIDLIRGEMKLHKKDRRFPKKGRLQEIISSSRNRQIPIEKVIEKEFSGLIDYVKDIEILAAGYQRYKKIANVLDYDDLMDELAEHLKKNQRFRTSLQKQYRYILVDEYQDTNLVQKEIVDLVAEKHHNVMVVGDDSQSIYGFRGANFENILLFPDTYPDCKVIKLEQNYRSNQGILDFANGIVENAKIGYKKKLFTEKKSTFIPEVRKFYSQYEEAEYIVDKIIELREKGIELNRVAVLYRAVWHGNYVQTELLKRNIPYVMVGGLKFTERKHIKDMISYLRLLLNPLDAVSWNRVLKLLPGIGNIATGKIMDSIRQKNGRIDFIEFSNKKYYPDLKILEEMMLEARKEKYPLPKKLEFIRNYYQPILEARDYDHVIRMNDIGVLIDMGNRYDNIEKFLTDFALDPPSRSFQDKNQPLIDEGEENPVTLSTIHSAKGLEWYTVFIPYALDGLFPSSRALKDMEELEEERRLFYVACSRAEEQLYITMPSQVNSYDAFFSYPSRFIIEIQKDKYRFGVGMN